MTNNGLAIRLLDSTFSFASEDERWIDLLRKLWGPFTVTPSSPGSLPVSIERMGRGWRMRIDAATEVAGERVWDFAASIRLALENHALDTTNRVVGLHAAVVTDDRGALLLVGGVGVGKTTLAIGFIERGWRFSSDDVAPIDTTTGDIIRFPRPVGIKGGEAFESFLTRWQPPAWVEPPHHFFQLPAETFPLSEKERSTPLSVVFPRYDPDAPPALETQSPGAATVICMEHVHRSDPLALATIARLCDKAPAAQITYGSSDEGVAMVEEFLSHQKITR